MVGGRPVHLRAVTGLWPSCGSRMESSRRALVAGGQAWAALEAQRPPLVKGVLRGGPKGPFLQPDLGSWCFVSAAPGEQSPGACSLAAFLPSGSCGSASASWCRGGRVREAGSVFLCCGEKSRTVGYRGSYSIILGEVPSSSS